MPSFLAICHNIQGRAVVALAIIAPSTSKVFISERASSHVCTSPLATTGIVRALATSDTISQ